jgi:hypothetical protein
VNKPLLDTRRRSHVELAAAYTSDAWLPPLPGATERLTAILSAPGGVNRELLIAELKRDLAVVSALSRRLISQNTTGTGSLSLLRSAPQDTLRALVQPAELTHSKHPFDSVQSWQGARLVETAVAVTAAEALSSSFEVESELAYTCALLRQLGLSLLAWNYPHVFRRALGIVKPGEELDSTLGKILGFTPTLLTLTLLRSRDASPIVLRTLGDTWMPSPMSKQDTTLVEKLIALCQLSESLARMITRGTPDSSNSSWVTSRADLEGRLGSNGWMILEDELKWSLAAYAQIGLPESNPPPTVRALGKAAAGRAAPRLSLLHSHATVRRCRPETRRLITDFFLRAISPVGLQHAYRHLICYTAQRCGFSRGILFQRSSSDGAFTSSIRSSGWPELEAADPTNEIVERIRHAIVSEALLQGTTNSQGEPWVASLLGNSSKVLLYLELPTTVEPSERVELLHAFEALRAATRLLDSNGG